MSTVNSEIRFAVQAPSYITSNPSKVLASGEPIFFNNGTYVFGDGTTALNALTVYGSSGAWGSITGTLSNQTDLQNALNAKQNTITTGTTAQYFRGDLSLATFPTAVSSFTNDSGYITSSGFATFTNKRITARTGTVASSATPTINTDNIDYFSITALATAITSFTTNLSGTPTTGQTLWISITDNGTARAITWGASFESSGNITLPTTTVISTRLDVAFIWNEATNKWRCVGVA